MIHYNDNDKEKTQQTVIITGASKGIGYATAAYFLQANWRVINLSRTPCELTHVLNIAVDLMATDWETAVSQQLMPEVATVEQVCLVHNAALLVKDRVANLTAASLREVLELNIVVPNRLNRLLIPHMRANSSIIYIGSTLAEKAVANAASYVTSKHALVGLMRATCQDLADQKIHTCCICPGFTDTAMLRAHLQHDESVLNSIISNVTAKRLITPTEIAELVYYAAMHPVINGAVLHANLGHIEM